MGVSCQDDDDDDASSVELEVVTVDVVDRSSDGDKVLETNAGEETLLIMIEGVAVLTWLLLNGEVVLSSKAKSQL